MRAALFPVFTLTLVAQPVEGLAVHGAWKAEWGNHRWTLHVNSPGLHRVRIPWRRTDPDPAAKGLVLRTASGTEVPGLLRLKVDADAANLAFDAPEAGTYHLYPFAHALQGSPYYPRTAYLPREAPPAKEWLARTGLPAAAGSLPLAQVAGYEARRPEDAFHALDRGATAAEQQAFLSRHPEPWFAFGADRRTPLRQTRVLPEPWAQPGAASFSGQARPGEFYPFQVGLWAARRPLVDVRLRFEDLRGPGGARIPARALRCFNLGGTDWEGRDFTKAVHVDHGRLQALWIGVDLPAELPEGTYTGAVTVRDATDASQRLPLSLQVAGEPLADHGDSEPWRLSRLCWLDSRLAQEDRLVAPYTPIVRKGRHLALLGRGIELGPNGWPARVFTHFAPSLTELRSEGEDLLAAPIAFEALRDGKPLPLRWEGPRFLAASPSAVTWSATGKGADLRITLQGRLEFDGTLELKLQATALRDAKLDDLRLKVPMKPAFASHLMGLGHRGGRAPEPFTWRWNADLNQDALWLGAPRGGLQLTLKDPTYRRPLNTNFYLEQPLRLPDAWHNGGQGGVRFEHGTVTAFGGPRALQRGQTLHFHARLMVTPFRPVDTEAQWKTRFLHAYRPLEAAKATGATALNIHHATAVNPWINYPFLAPEALKAYVEGAHRRDLKVKLYYTVRELTTKAPELPVLRSLGDEVISPGAGGGCAWIQEHLEPPFLGAWHVPEIEDAAVVTSGVSRWHNHYVEGLDFLVRRFGIDGLYLDDLAFDRTTMKRLRRVLDQNGRRGLLDLHSANQFNPKDGYASSANLYLEHFPFLDRLWFGEYFDYGADPDQWLVEMSGLPFGLMGEMLQDGGNPWRGMVFGMTNRLPWEKSDPRPLWKAWDAFGLPGTRMRGWWDPACPVRTGREDVKATVYTAEGRALIALASWAKEPVEVRLDLDWKALGMDPAKAKLRAAAMEGFQEERIFQADQPVPLPPGKGWLIEVRASR